MRRSRTLVPLLTALLSLACVGNDVGVSSNYDPLVRFPTSATYYWDDAANVLPSDPAFDRAGTDALFHDVANEAFAARGYRVVTGDAPANYRLSYHYNVDTYLGPDVSRALGSVSLQLVDNATGQRVWVGFGRAEVHAGLSPEERRARLADAMKRMLKGFPPSGRAD